MKKQDNEITVDKFKRGKAAVAARRGQRLAYLKAGGEADGLPRLRGGRRPTVGARARARAKYKIFFIYLFTYFSFLQISDKSYFRSKSSQNHLKKRIFC